MKKEVKLILTLPQHIRIKPLLEYFGISQINICKKSGRGNAMVCQVIRGRQRNIYVEQATIDLLNEKKAGVAITDLWTAPVKRRAVA